MHLEGITVGGGHLCSTLQIQELLKASSLTPQHPLHNPNLIHS